MKKNISLLLVGLFALSANAQHAKIHIKTYNMNQFFFDRYTFFEENKESQVDKLGEGEFLITYWGKTPKIFNINFREVLVTPGDDVDLTYKLFNDTTGRDTMIVNGQRNDNYTFSNMELSLMPRIEFEGLDFSGRTALSKVFESLNKRFGLRRNKISDYLDKTTCAKEIKDYLLRNYDAARYYDYVNIGKKIAGTKNKQLMRRHSDSLFNSLIFNPQDTVHGRYMQVLFENHFKNLVEDNFNKLATAKDLDGVVSFVDKYPNAFIRKHFIYFLGTNYLANVKEYKNERAQVLIAENKYMQRVRHRSLQSSSIY